MKSPPEVGTDLPVDSPSTVLMDLYLEKKIDLLCAGICGLSIVS
jgi:hypothetical protein